MEAITSRGVGIVNDIDLAQMLFRKSADIVSEAFGGRLPTYTVEAEAMADSVDGFVQVQFAGDTVNLTDGDPDGAGDVPDDMTESGTAAQWVEVPCSSNIREGDRVLVTMQDGAPIDATTIGSGDRVYATASQAEAIATATDQHFWSDTNGIHVSTDDHDAAGTNNILINSLGILLRELTTVLLELSASGVIVGDQSGTHLAVESSGIEVLSDLGEQILEMQAGARGTSRISADRLSDLTRAILRVKTDAGLTASQGDTELYLCSESTSTASEAAIRAYSPTSSAAGTTAEVRALSGYGSTDPQIQLNAGSIRINETYAPMKVVANTAAIGNVSAGSGFSVSKTVTAQSGYTAVGVVGHNQTHNQAGNMGGVYLSGTTLYGYGKNDSTSNWTGTNDFTWYVLYIRSELL